MDGKGDAKVRKKLEYEVETNQGVKKISDQTRDVNFSVQLERVEEYDACTVNRVQDESKFLFGEDKRSSRGWFGVNSFDEIDDQGSSSSSMDDTRSSDEQSNACLTPEANYQRTDLLQQSSFVEISLSKYLSATPPPRPQRGLDHGNTAPVGTRRNPFFESHGVALPSSMIERTGSPMHDLQLNRLSEHEKVNSQRNGI